ncbi:toll-like receptor 2 [Tubulanus polymorphus]|uniref:toll-like receptor 2 n=1 Tax=Tubulanus polymorphus TaxID=672921 RepID=UPI003DA69017
MAYCRTNFKKHQFKGLVNLRNVFLVQNNIQNLNLTEFIISHTRLDSINALSSPGLTCFDSRTSFTINNRLTKLLISCIIELNPGESPCGTRSPERAFYLRKDIKNLRKLHSLVIHLKSPFVFLCLKSFDLLPESMHYIEIDNLAGPFNYYLKEQLLHNACESLMWNKTFYKLTLFVLTGTIIGSCPSHVLRHILSRVPSVEVLDLSSNGIRHLDINAFEAILNLKFLRLKYNRLSTIQPGLLKPLTNLRVLNLASNQLKTFDPDEIINLRHFISISLLGNTFECDCQLRKLRNWLKELGSRRTKKHYFYDFRAEKQHNHTTIKLVCTSPKKLSGVAIADFQLHWIECDNHKDIIISFSTLCVAAIIMAIGRIVAKKKWQIYYWWMVKINRFLPKLLRIATVSRSDDMKFDGFLSHSMEDLQFVYLDFIPEIEKSKDFASKFCVEFRDFTIGGYIQQNNIDAIYGSRWVVFLLTESFIEERWVEFVISMAANRCVEEGKNIIIVLDIDHIPESRMPESLRTIISNVVYMKYPRDDKARSTFWKKVRLTLIGKQKKFIQPANMYRSNR